MLQVFHNKLCFALTVVALQVPLILVCPGTGLSPCRALVQARLSETERIDY